MHGKVFCYPTPFCATGTIFSACFSPGLLSLASPTFAVWPFLAFRGVSCDWRGARGIWPHGEQVGVRGAAQKAFSPSSRGSLGCISKDGAFLPPTTSARLLLLQARFVAPVSWVMPAIAAYFVVRPHTFLLLFAPTVRKTWGLAQTLRLPLAATTPRWISPSVD